MKKIKQSRKVEYVFTISFILIALIFYPILPHILNYPPDSINNEFQKGIDLGLTYTQQYLFLMFASWITGLILIHKKVKKIDDIYKLKGKKYNHSQYKLVSSIFNMPYIVYLTNILVPTIIVILVYAISEGNINIGTLKIGLLILTIETLIALLVFMYCKNLISGVLKEVYIDKNYIKKIISLKNRIFIVIMPMILVALIFTSLLGYTRLVQEKSEYMFYAYETKLKEVFKNKYYTETEVAKLLNSIELFNDKDTKFIIYDKDKCITLNNKKISKFFIKYTIELSDSQNERTYETYGIDIQGAVKKINLDGKIVYVGVIYNVTDISTLTYFGMSILAFFILNCIVLYYISKSLADDTSKVVKALNNILKHRNTFQDKYLPITSNDEISSLVIAFNEIQDLTKAHIEKIEDNEYVMQRQAQFAILGEFAAGIAHDLNSPLSAVQLDIATLQDYIKSDKVTTDEETEEIISEIVMNINNSLSRMGKTVESVRNQIRSTGNSEKEQFSVKELVEGIDILFGSILRKNNCVLDNLVDEKIIIFGEKNKLDRVVGNIIKNSIDAYSENKKFGKIEVNAKQDEKEITIIIKDDAGGIPKEIQKSIFKEMKTTKKQNGTGFGLYYSNTIIESSFKGKIEYKTKENEGTTFYIKLPVRKENE